MKHYVQMVLGLVFLVTAAAVAGAFITGCSGPQLKRCDSAAAEADLWSCPEQVSGVYRKCVKPVDVFHCQAPQ